MIVYDLICDAHHRCEGWFDGVDDYRHQLTAGLLTCPVCGSDKVQKVPSASRVHIRGTPDPAGTGTPDPQTRAARELLRRLRDFVETQCDDVGRDFAKEARRIHTGEAEERNIRGSATPEEVTELREDGIETLVLPPLPPDDDKLN